MLVQVNSRYITLFQVTSGYYLLVHIKLGVT